MILLRLLWWCSLLLSVLTLAPMGWVWLHPESDLLGNGVVFVLLIPAGLASLSAFVVPSIVMIFLELSPPEMKRIPIRTRPNSTGRNPRETAALRRNAPNPKE